MIEIALNGVKKFFSTNLILENATFDIQTGERAAIVGRNGSGKSTLLKIITGIEKLDKEDGGTISIRKNCVIGYLDQIPLFDETFTVQDVLNTAFHEVSAAKLNMTKLETLMGNASNEELEKLLKKYGEFQTEFERLGGYEIEEKLSKICTGLKISEDMRRQPFSKLSGGEKTTVVLGKILLQNPDVLLLDEPTNHLDMESIEWLEEFISSYNGTVVAVSHDRYFLDKVVTKIIEVEDKETITYNGNYSYYLEEKEKRLMEEFKDFENQQKQIESMKKAIAQLRDWAIRGGNNKFFKRAESIQKRLDKIQKIKRPVLERAKIQLSFSLNERSGKDAVVAKNLKKAFGTKLLFEDLNFHLRYGEKAALIGSNGCGKSTFIKLLLGSLTPDSGEITIGSSVKIGYLPQEVTFEDEELSIVDTFRSFFNYSMTEGEARGILSHFLFYGSDVFKKIRNLSGGEKSRLRLCMLMHTDINLLILDEPTNHLDIDSREMLEEALTEYDGTVLFISHDRYFINKVCERIVELSNKTFTNYAGNYEYYKAKRKASSYEKEPEPKKAKTVVKKHHDTTNKNKFKEENIEREISILEKQISDIEGQMESCNDYEKLNELFKDKSAIQDKLNSLMEEWMEML